MDFGFGDDDELQVPNTNMNKKRKDSIDSEPTTNQTTASSDTLNSDHSLHGPHNGFIREEQNNSLNTHLPDGYNNLGFDYYDAEKEFSHADESQEDTLVHHNGGVIIDAPLKLNGKFPYPNYTIDTFNGNHKGPNQFAGTHDTLGIEVTKIFQTSFKINF